MSGRYHFPAPLDPDFAPAILWNRAYVQAAKKSGRAVPLVIALEREEGLVSRFETIVRDEGDVETRYYVERLVKFLLWSRGGWKISVGGPKSIGEFIRKAYSPRGARSFDCNFMAATYGRNFQVAATTPDEVPAQQDRQIAAGGNFSGCRIGFDLGASGLKVSAVIDGELVFHERVPWSPENQPDPDYHYRHLSAALHLAAAHLPRVDAIGGSSAGIIVDNEIRAASLFRAVSKEHFPKAAGLFKRLQKEWNVPLVVMNDGDVSALAGALSLKTNGMLGLAMGSSEAAGFMDKQGCVPGCLNELAFAPVDYNAEAATDEWSGDRGVGALYFSQQAVNKLLPEAKIRLPEKMSLPERLNKVQSLMEKGDGRAAAIYETIGVYLGYTIPHYADFYDFRRIMILGGVMMGGGGDIVLEKAQEVLWKVFPGISTRIGLHVPHEENLWSSQAVAAASLPSLPGMNL